VADETKKRTTSFAKSLEDLAKTPSPLDRLSPDVREAFTRAADDLQWQNDRAGKKIEEKEKSDERPLTYAPRPEMHLRPDGAIARSMNRKIDYGKLREVNAAAKKRARQAERSRGLSREFEQER